MKLDTSRPHEKIVDGSDVGKRRILFIQDDIEFDVRGNPLDEAQVKRFYAEQAAAAQEAADEAMRIAQAAQEDAEKTRTSLGVTKTAVKKAQKDLKEA